MAVKRNALAALWGFAEACIFFIVPDVLLSWYALSGVRRALLACLYALVGALAGGALVWFLGSVNPEPLRGLYAALPGIDPELIASVQDQLSEQGLLALLLGPLRGTPYKLYVLEASVQQLSWLGMVLVSIPARLTRFVLVTLLVGGIRRLVGERLGLNGARAVHLLCWTAFYAWYFQQFG